MNYRIKLTAAAVLLAGMLAASCAHPDYQTRVTNVREGGEGYDVERVPIVRPPAPPPPPPSTPLPPGNAAIHETGVRKAESDWMAALKAHNTDALGDLSEDQLVLTTPNGEAMGKDDFVGAITNGSLVVQSEEISDEHVAEYGNAAVMTGLLKVQATRDGNDISGTYRFVDTWIWKQGQWRKAAAVFMSVTQ